MRPSRTDARAPACASTSAFTNHWSVRNGSMTTCLVFSSCGTMIFLSSTHSDRADRLEIVEHLLRASKRSSPRYSLAAPCALILALRREDVDRPQAMALADLEIVEIVRRGDLDRARAQLRVGVFVGDDRDAAADQRQDRRACRRDAGSARQSDAPRRRRRRASSRAASWRRRSSPSLFSMG